MESIFQRKLIKYLEKEYPGCIILKNDANYRIGILDLIILFEDRWAALEAKDSATADHGPNQDYYVNKMAKMSYASFIYPENKEQVLYELQLALRAKRSTRFSRS